MQHTPILSGDLDAARSSATAGPHRRIATRYEKLAANQLAIIKLTAIRFWLRVNESTT